MVDERIPFMNHQPSTMAPRSLCLCVSVVLAASAAGCIRRTLEVTSDPPGAQLIVNGQPAGVTPVKMAFRHQGTYRVELRKDGFAPVVTGLRLGYKLYELPPIEPAAELLWPGVIRDGRSAHYRLEPLKPVDRAKAVAAARAAAAEAEKLIPRLYEAPRAGKQRDRALLPGPKPPEAPKKKRSDPEADDRPGR
jgi:hypothetical protein